MRDTLNLLIRASRLVAQSSDSSDLLPLLARATVDFAGARAAAVLEIEASGPPRAAAVWSLPESLVGWTGDPDLAGADLGHAFASAAGLGHLPQYAAPLATGGDLFGWLIVLLPPADTLDADRLALIAGLADLAATSLGRAQRERELRRYRDELQASRDALAQTQKLRMLGEMAAGISHDLKNILNPISLHLQLLKRGVAKADTESHESIVDMQQAVRRGVETIDRLREFSRQAPATRSEAADLNHLAREAVKIVTPRIRSSLDMRVRLVEQLGEPPRVLLHAGDAVTALVNLLVNAIDAIQAQGNKPGLVTVATGTHVDDGWIRISDTGAGMTPDLAQRIFDPFFTTKGVNGTGLGLAMVFAFVQRHRGEVKVDTTPGEGSAFTLWFPSATALQVATSF